eukprot:scaffold170744_cov56-Attheya_sp.AAC.8
MDVVGTSIVLRIGGVDLFDAHGIGNLASCFASGETSFSVDILKVVCHEFQNIDVNAIELQNVADVSNVTWMAQRLHVASPAILQWICNLAIAKSNESRPADARDILLSLSRVDVPIDVYHNFRLLLRAYQPYFQ